MKNVTYPEIDALSKADLKAALTMAINNHGGLTVDAQAALEDKIEYMSDRLNDMMLKDVDSRGTKAVS